LDEPVVRPSCVCVGLHFASQGLNRFDVVRQLKRRNLLAMTMLKDYLFDL
jgi:hypothetical protein